MNLAFDAYTLSALEPPIGPAFFDALTGSPLEPVRWGRQEPIREPFDGYESVAGALDGRCLLLKCTRGSMSIWFRPRSYTWVTSTVTAEPGDLGQLADVVVRTLKADFAFVQLLTEEALQRARASGTLSASTRDGRNAKIMLPPIRLIQAGLPDVFDVMYLGPRFREATAGVLDGVLANGDATEVGPLLRVRADGDGARARVSAALAPLLGAPDAPAEIRLPATSGK